MSSMSGSEIARLVLGYLQSQRMDKIALDFCKLSPYLREEYGILKRGLKIKQASKPRTLLDIIREFIEIEETVSEFVENEFKRHENVPKDLIRLQSLKDKVQYACRMFGTSSESQKQCTATRKRPNVSVIECEYDSDSEASSHSSPRATNVQDLPGYSRPPLKRRKLYDPNLIIASKSDAVCLDGTATDRSKSTPLKTSDQFQEPASSKQLQKSASKVVESIIAHDFADVIAKSINEAFDSNISTLQLSDKLPDILTTTSNYPTFDDIIAEVCPEIYEEQSLHSSSAASKPASEQEYNIMETATNRSLDTPVPNNESRRYELRSQKKITPALNTSTESKPKRNAKVHIVSDELLPPITIPDSDSEGTVTTTSQQQAQQQNIVYFDPQSQSWFLIKSNYVDQSQSQPTTSTATVFGNPISNAADQSHAFPPDDSNGKILNLDNFTIVNSNALQSNPIVISDVSQTEAISNGDDNRSRFIVINNDEVRKEGKQPIENTQLEQSAQREQTIQIDEKPIESLNDTEQKQATAPDVVDDKTVALRQLKQITEPKVVTPKQLIKSNIPGTSRCLSTPRNKNPHVRVLDFNTPSRFRLSEIGDNKGDPISNTSRFFSETPQNRSITSSMPSSAPAKVNSVTQSLKKSSENSRESEPFVPTDENTVVSVEGETPKVRKTNRKSVRRTISAQKEIDPQENKKRLKRVVLTKKKICSDDGDSDTAKKDVKVEVPVSLEDAAAEWERIKNAKNNPELFEQQLREQNSKKQNEIPTGRRRRSKRTKKTPVIKVKPITQPQDSKLDETIKSVDVSMNSSLDQDTLNSTLTNLEARMLEENLKSAKKLTPAKPIIAPKSVKKKMQMSKVQIKLMPSPKNKAAKRLKNKKELNSAKVKNSNEVIKNEQKSEQSVDAAPTEAQQDTTKPMETEMEMETEALKTNENTTDDLEVAQNLLSMQEMILKQENERKMAQTNEVQSDSVSMSKANTVAVAVSKTASEPMVSDNRIDTEALRSTHQPNLSMSALLETPYKDGIQTFPKTPCIGNILPQLVTPLLRPCESLMDDSIFKNPQFPTPNFPITPGSIFTPFKDMLSPRSDQELVYGAPNRPTDYSSSSSYYKPDESDGIDKQIQASVQSVRTNSGVYSADEIEDHSKTEDTTQNTLNSSTSSSSSSDSDSDTDSDSSSSSDSDASRASNKSPNKSPEKSPDKSPDKSSIKSSPEPLQPEPIDEDSTQIIKSHLVSTSEMNIAKNILLSVPEEPILSEEAIRQSLLDEKRRRMQESLREVEMKNHEKPKSKQTKKTRATAERERIRGPPVVASPSKRKSTQPKKIVSINSRQIYSHCNVVSAEKDTDIEVKSQTLTTEHLITEAAGDNAIVDASDVSTAQNLAVAEEESVEAIKSHINRNSEVIDDVQPPAKGTVVNLSPEGLIDMLSEKQRKLNANKPKTKTEVIDALPMPRTTRSRTKSAKIAPAQNIIAKSTRATSSFKNRAQASASSSAKTTSTTDSSKETRKSNSSVERSIKPTKPAKIESVKSAPAKSVVTANRTNKSNDKFITPAKEKQARQIHDIFGDCADIETPIKSPLRVAAKPNTTENKCNKFEADSSNVQDSDDGNESSSEDEYEYEMIFSIDETDKKRFISLRENSSIKAKQFIEPVIIGRKNVVMECGAIVLEPSDEMELFTQDIMSVAKMKKDRRRTTKETKTEASNEPTSSSEYIYGKPLHTSTPSPNKKLMPKFNIKHKSSDTVSSPKSTKKQSPSEFFTDIVVDDVLVQLHPGTTA